MHTNAPNNFAHEIYIYSGVLIYSLNGIVLIFFFPITKQLLMLQIWSEDLNIPLACSGMLVAVPVHFLEWGWNRHRTTLHLYWSVLHPLTSPKHPSPQRNLVPTPVLFIISASWLPYTFLFPHLKQSHNLHRKQSATSSPNPDCDCCFFLYSHGSLGFITYSTAEASHASHPGIGLEVKSVR